MEPKIVYQVVHRPTGDLWSCPDARCVWPDLNSAVTAYNMYRQKGTPFYSGQTVYAVRAVQIKMVPASAPEDKPIPVSY